jgi:hypothetical protein
MEAIIGFAVGYWVGTRQGRQGVQEALDSARAIIASPEARKLAAEGLAALEAAAPALNVLAKRRGTGATVLRGVVEDFVERSFERRAQRAA